MIPLPYLVLLFSLFITPALVAQEICDNGQDDDGDGLVDLNDSIDCSCGFLPYPESLLPNPSFEFFDQNNEGCITAIPEGFPDNFSQANCLNGWQAVSNGTTDAWNTTAVTTRSLGTFQTPRPLPSGTGLAGFVAYSSQSNSIDPYREYLGACTTNEQSINAGEAYRLSLELGVLAPDTFPSASSLTVAHFEDTIRLAVYGVRDCDDLFFAGVGCPEESGAVGYELITTVVMPASPGWNTLSADFTPQADYSAMVFGWPCGNEPVLSMDFNHTVYYYVDELRVNTVSAYEANENSPGGPIGVQGEALCDDDFLLLGRSVTGATYQWYRDGVAIVEATGVNYKPEVRGRYQLRTTAPQGCSVSAEVFVQLPYIPTRILADTVAFCGQDSVTINAFIPTINTTYLWDDGSTLPFRRVGRAGTYSVTLTTPCEVRVSNIFASTTATPSFTVSQRNENGTCEDNDDQIVLTINSDFDNLFIFLFNPDTTFYGNGFFSADAPLILSTPYPDELLVVGQTSNCSPYYQTVFPGIVNGLDVSATIEPVVCTEGDGSIRLSWTDDGSDFVVNWTDVNGVAVGTNSPVLSVNQPGDYTVNITETGGCDFTETYTLPSASPITTSLNVEERNCGEENTVLLVLAGIRGEPLVEWYDELANLIAVDVTEQQNLAPGNYRIEVSDDFGCTSTERFRLLGPTQSSLAIEAVSTSFCGDGTGAITVNIPDGRSDLLVSLNGATPVMVDGFDNLPAGGYLVEVTDVNNCLFYRDSVKIARQGELDVVLSGNDQVIRLGEATRLRALVSPTDSNLSLSWSPPGVLTCTDCPSPLATPLVSTTFTLTATLNNCSVSDSLSVIVVPGAPYYLPTAFSPNGDGVNDDFRLFASAGILSAEMEIFNRWGARVYSGEVLTAGWDGKFRGRLAANGVYYYSGNLVLVDGSVLALRGALTLLR